MPRAIGVFNGNWKNKWRREIENVASEPLPADHVWSRYWSVKRKAKSKKGKWIFVRAFQATKQEMAEIFVKYYSDGNHRLIHHFSYEPKHDHNNTGR